MEYTKVEMNAEMDDRQSLLDILPCDFETVLAFRQTGTGIHDLKQTYLKFSDGYWQEVRPPKGNLAGPKGFIERVDVQDGVAPSRPK